MYCMNDERQKLSTVTCTYVPVVQGLVGGAMECPIKNLRNPLFSVIGTASLQYHTVFDDRQPSLLRFFPNYSTLRLI